MLQCIEAGLWADQGEGWGVVWAGDRWVIPTQALSPTLRLTTHTSTVLSLWPNSNSSSSSNSVQTCYNSSSSECSKLAPTVAPRNLLSYIPSSRTLSSVTIDNIKLPTSQKLESLNLYSLSDHVQDRNTESVVVVGGGVCYPSISSGSALFIRVGKKSPPPPQPPGLEWEWENEFLLAPVLSSRTCTALLIHPCLDHTRRLRSGDSEELSIWTRHKTNLLLWV